MPEDELVTTAEPAPGDVQYLEDRIYEFNLPATGIADGSWLAIFMRDHGQRIVAGICGKTRAAVRRSAAAGGSSIVE